MKQQEMSSSPARTVEVGAAAGAVATAAMSAFMKVWQWMVPAEGSRPIPPREVTRGVTEKAGIWQQASAPARTALTWASHFGYGTTMAVGYAATAARLPAPRAATGALFGLGVWAASYAGWLPALGILPPPQDKPGERTAQLVGAHLVWGTVLGLSAGALSARRRPAAAPAEGDVAGQRPSIPD